MAAAFTTTSRTSRCRSSSLAELGLRVRAGRGHARPRAAELLGNDGAVPLSLLFALFMNFEASVVNPAALLGPFPTSPFANLTHADKAKVFERIERTDTDLIATLDDQPARAAAQRDLRHPQVRRRDAAGVRGLHAVHRVRRLRPCEAAPCRARPVGWEITKYLPGRTTPVDGRNDFIGYYKKHKTAAGRAPEYRIAKKKRKRKTRQRRRRRRPPRSGGAPMPDVIIIGAGGGGPVAAKELAAHGLDVMLLEAGPYETRPREQLVALRERRQQPDDGLPPLRPGRPLQQAQLVPRRCRRTASSGSSPASAAPRSTTTATTRARCRARSTTTTAPTRTRTTSSTASRSATASCCPTTSGSRRRCPCRRRRWGARSSCSSRARRASGLPLNRYKDVTRASFRPQENAILQPRGTAGQDRRTRRS